MRILYEIYSVAVRKLRLLQYMFMYSFIKKTNVQYKISLAHFSLFYKN